MAEHPSTARSTSPVPAEDKETVRAVRADVRSMGCRLNLAEGEAIRQMIAPSLVPVNAPGAEAQDKPLVVINSCAVTNEAVRQTRQTIRRARRDKPDARIVVTGCAAQIDPGQFTAMDEVDHVIGNTEKLQGDTWDRLAGRDTAPEPPRLAVNDIMSVRETAAPLIDGYGERARAFLQIQNGCNHRCTFCIIPYGRGNARSAPISAVVDQARRLIDRGHCELVLTGVDITSWGEDLDGQPKLGRLVQALLDGCPDLFRLRLSSIDGAEIDPALFECLSGEARIAPHVHLSVQSGDNMILKRMKRRHDRETIIRLCDDLRTRRPEIAFGADIIAGFPTETEAMFDNSRRLIGDAGLSYLHVFPFSPRDGTPAARMPQLARSVIKERARLLREDGSRAQTDFLDTLIGLETQAVRESGGRVRLGNFAEARLEHADQIDTDAGIVRVVITGHRDHMLSARRAGDAPDTPQPCIQPGGTARPHAAPEAV